MGSCKHIKVETEYYNQQWEDAAMTMQEYLRTFDATKLFGVYYDNYNGELSDDVTKDDEEALEAHCIPTDIGNGCRRS